MKSPGRHTRRFFRMLVEARWFFSFSSSVCATVVGITLTFGINSCREKQRQRQEMQKSMLQAVDNLEERLVDAGHWLEKVKAQNRLYEELDSIYYTTGVAPDSLCEEFRTQMLFTRMSAFDHDFERVFRGSYQLWQLQSSNDSLAYYIAQCYDCVNYTEETCETLTEDLLTQIGEINAIKKFYGVSSREWALDLITDSRFQYFMTIRIGKTTLAQLTFDDAMDNYETNIIRLSDPLYEE